jgi:hypothetical protein
MLVCDVPRQEIRNAYSIVQKICFPDPADTSNLSPCPSMPSTLDGSLSISTLQVWVDQYDPDNDDSFYSSVPAAIGRFPVQPNPGTPTRPDVGYRPWYFESASPNWVKLTGCNYPEFPALGTQAVTILGRGISKNFRTQVLQAEGLEYGCQWFVIPTLALIYPQVVVEYPSFQSNLDVSSSSPDVPYSAPPTMRLCADQTRPSPGDCTPESLSTALFQPNFDTPTAIHRLISSASNAATIDQWTIDIPAGRIDCDDALNILDADSKFNAVWKVGSATVPVRGIGDPAPVHGLSEPIPQACYDRLDSVVKKAQDAAATARKVANEAEAAAELAKKKADTAGTAADVAKAETDASNAKKKATDADANAAKLEAITETANQKANAAKDANEFSFWNEASKTGQIMLELVVHRADLGDLPLKNQVDVLRGPLLSRIAALPDLRPSFLPTKLTVVGVGTNQFALQGDNAGVIDAVNIQGPDGVISTIPTVSGGQTAFVTITASKGPAKSETPAKPPVIEIIARNSVPGGTQVKITGSGFDTAQGSVSFGGVPAVVDTNCWLPTSIIVDIPLNVPPGSVAVTVTTKPPASQTAKPYTFTVAEKPLPWVEPTNCPAPPSDPSNNGQTGSGPKAGAYSIVPLIALSKDSGGKVRYMPLDVVDPNGKPLYFTVAESKDAGTTAPKGTDSPTTTLTISKKTTVTPAPAAATGGGTP